jgi:hypothetical protein
MIVSAGARESMQLSNAAIGYWPAAVAFCCARKLWFIRPPLAKRLLPFFISARTSSGDSLSRFAFESASAKAVPLSAVAPSATSAPRKLRR